MLEYETTDGVDEGALPSYLLYRPVESCERLLQVVRTRIEEFDECKRA